jgi:hypothetical protein
VGPFGPIGDSWSSHVSHVLARRRIRSCYYGACTIIALVAIILCAAQARASCGDWLADHRAESKPVAASAARPQNTTLSSERDRGQEHQSPCRGLSCGKAPTEPSDIPPPHARESDGRQFAALANSPPPPSSTARFAVASDDAQPPTATRSPPEHPPRASAAIVPRLMRV